MLIRRRDESFTTLDMAIIDTRRKKVEFTKMGSWPSYLKRGRTVERISSSALPIGILPSVEFETIVRTIHKGDYVVMASDGVLGCSSDMDVVDRWILQYLKSTSITCPRELVNALADDMRAELNVIWDDDVTLIAVKVP
jgi:stage II sporulation protein E